MSAFPDVVVIVFDTARADAFEPYGAPPGSTPAVAELARRGLAVDGVISTSAWTLPSHVSLFSGALPRQAGLGGGDRRPADVLAGLSARLLPVVLAHRGYRTRAASANPWITPQFGFGIGFDEFSPVPSRRQTPEPGLRGSWRWLAHAAAATIDDGLTRIEALIDDWSRSTADDPLFTFVNLMECHSPYLPPRPHNDLDLVQRVLAGRDARKYQSHLGFLNVCLGDLAVPDASLRRMRHLYARSVLLMDDWLARFLDRLDSRGRLDETLVVITSDHGENLGENGLLGHSMSLDDRLLHVPLVAAGPGCEHLAGVQSLADVPAAVAAGIGLRSHPWSEPACPDGVPIAQDDGMLSVDHDMAELLVSGWNIPEGARHALDTPRTAVHGGRFKLVVEGDDTRLHDLDRDPLEARDVGPEHPEVVEQLQGFLRQAESIELDPSTGISPSQPTTSVGELEDRLKLLGYL